MFCQTGLFRVRLAVMTKKSLSLDHGDYVMCSWQWKILLFCVSIAILQLARFSYAAYQKDSYEVIMASGRVCNSHGKGIKDVELSFWLDGKRIVQEHGIRTSSDGSFETMLRVAEGSLARATLEIEAVRHSYSSPQRAVAVRVAPYGLDPEGHAMHVAWFNVTLQRSITPGFWVATVVLLGVYGLIAFELVHRTLAAMLGAAMMLFATHTLGVFHHGWAILGFEDASRAIDMNVILLLLAMMIIVGVLKRTGVFQWIAYKAFQVARGNVFALAGLLMFVTSLISAFLDNVTTMLLVFPVTFQICQSLRVNPVAVLVPCAFSSNIGGTATLIGDPPNIMIGSYAKLTFMDFVGHLTLICLVAQFVTIFYFLVWHRKDYGVREGKDREALVETLRQECQIADRGLLTKSLLVLAATIFLFVIHGALHMEPSIAALVGAGILMMVGRVNIVEMLEKEIEWPTLIFFMMLFIVVAGAEEVGLIEIVAEWVREVSRGSLLVAVIVILWVSALFSAIIDNIPFTATMLPIVSYLNQTIPGAGGGALWWALALGACLGGNGTMIGASANVVTVGMLEKAGYPVSFRYYLKVAFPPMLLTVAMCMFWLILFDR